MTRKKRKYLLWKHGKYILCRIRGINYIIILLFIAFMRVIYKYTPEKKSLCRVNTVAVNLWLQFVLHVMLFRPWNIFCTFTFALSVVCLQCSVWPFFFFVVLNFCFPGMLLPYCLSDFEMVPVAPIFTGITFLFTFHRGWFSILRY